MRNPSLPHPSGQAGTTLIEVLVTVVMLAFGLLGIAAFQAKAQVGSIEAYQRAQAVVLLEDMQARMIGNGPNIAQYTTVTPLGTGNTQYTDCGGLAGAERDKCEWSRALQGASEVAGSDKLGAMKGARGCIEQLQAINPAEGACQPGIYLITLAWQGLHPTAAPALACGKDAYGADTNRRAISVRVSLGVQDCRK
jgi:type IV pilus assembly protein PilV